jgi:hypothetical protein
LGIVHETFGCCGALTAAAQRCTRASSYSSQALGNTQETFTENQKDILGFTRLNVLSAQIKSSSGGRGGRGEGGLLPFFFYILLWREESAAKLDEFLSIHYFASFEGLLQVIVLIDLAAALVVEPELSIT